MQEASAANTIELGLEGGKRRKGGEAACEVPSNVRA